MGLQRIVGHRGEIKAGYKVVATITRYVYATNPPGDPPGWTVEGDVADVDSFYAERGGPFDLILSLGTGKARWKGVPVALSAAGFTASGQGPPETI